MPKIYTNTNLTGLQCWNERITSPTKRSLSGLAIRKIEYLQTKAYLRMHSILALNLSYVMAVALPVFALMDALASPFKVLYFTATLNGKGVKEELVSAAKHFALIFFSIPAAYFSITKSQSVYHSLKTWKNIKADKFASDLVAKELELRKESSKLTRKSLAEAIRVILPTILASKKARERVDKIIDAILKEVKIDSADSEIVAEHYISWFSKFILECVAEGLPLDTIDETFFKIITVLVRLHMPATRITLMEEIVNDYGCHKKCTEAFKTQLIKLETERNKKIEHYIQNLEKQKAAAIKNKNQEIGKKKEQYLAAENDAQALETLETALKQVTLTKFLGEKVQSIISPSKKQKLSIKKEVEALIRSLPDCKIDSPPMESGLKLMQQVAKSKSRLQKKAEGIKKSFEKAKESQQQMIVEKAKFSNQSPVSDEKLQEKYPVYSSHFSYLPLYLSLKYLGADKEEQFQGLFSLIKNARFKDATYYGYLMNFLLRLKIVESTVAFQALETLINYSKSDDKKLNRTLTALKNGNILLKMEETLRFASLVKDPRSTLKLDSETLIGRFFTEKFNLSDIEKYQGEEGLKALTADFEKTFGSFRDPIAIMTYYSTLSTLPQSQRKSTLASLTCYVKYVLGGEGFLRQKRHDISINAHLRMLYRKYPEIKEKWENTQMLKVTDIDPELSKSPMKNYTIGETEDPCDLLMQSTEVTKSCMHILGRANKARGLIGHMLDGKTHPIVIKNDKGSIVARVLMRIMEDKKQKKPILVIDYLYSSSTSSEIKKKQKRLIITFCKKKAAEMNLDLVTIQSNAKGFGPPVKSYGNPAAYEHVNTFDAPDYKTIYPDGMTDGNYTIRTTYLV